jgi:hypothetical protein
MTDGRLFLVSANKSRPGGLQWDADDYDVRAAAADGPVVGRIYRSTQSPEATPWFWTIIETPVTTADRDYAETREAAMAAFKARWESRGRRSGGTSL